MNVNRHPNDTEQNENENKKCEQQQIKVGRKNQMPKQMNDMLDARF